MTLDRIFPAVTSLLIVLFSFLLYRGLRPEVEIGDRQQIGTVYFKNRVAQRKLQGVAIWQDLGQESPVYNRDTLRTEELSEASVKLLDGTKIEMDQNSMIVLAVSAKAAQIRFAGGSVRAVGSGSAGSKGVEITAGDRTIETSKGDVQLSSAKKGELVVSVRKGEAKLTVAGQERKLKENEQSTVAGNKVDIRTVDIRPTAPADNHRLYTTNRAQIHFAWTGVSGAAILEVGTDRSFGRLHSKRTATDATTAALPPGLYYWRVRSADGKGTSTVRRISVLKTEAVRLYSPLNRATVEMRESKRLVSFSWSRSDTASSYFLEIADNAAFSGMSRVQTSGSSLAREMGPGAFFWRVRTLPAEAETVSTTFRGALVRSEVRVRHVLLSPADSLSRSRKQINDGGLFFNWLAQDGVERYALELAADPGFTKIVHRSANANAYSQFRGDLAAGVYYWRVSASASGRTTVSPVRRLTVNDSLAAPQILAPSNGAVVDMSDRSSLDFSWSSVPGADRYRLELVRKRDGRRIVAETVSGASYSLRRLELLSSGLFTVTVRAEGQGRRGDPTRVNFAVTIRPLPVPQILK